MSMIPAGSSPFDSIKHVDDSGEFWLARELMPLLGYDKWNNFIDVVRTAKEIHTSQGNAVNGVFTAISKNPGKSGGRPSAEYDYRLNRHACYLVALSAEGSKAEVAAAKIYFATKTRQQEKQEEREEYEKEHSIQAYVTRGYSREWAIERIKGLAVRARLTESWKRRGGADFYGLLTEILHSESLDIGTQEHMALKGFEQGKDGRYHGELRPAMTIREMAVTSFTESMAHAEHEEKDSHGITQLQRDCHVAGKMGRDVRLIVEQQTGQKVVTSTNAVPRPDNLFAALSAPSDDDDETPPEGC